MTLYEFINVTQMDYDTCDTVYDAIITVCYIDEETEDYDRFCNAIIKKVQVEKQVDSDTIIVNWTKLIQDNMEKFKKFTAENWYSQYEDDEDEFIYQWIREIDSYMAGYVHPEFYTILVEFVETLI